MTDKVTVDITTPVGTLSFPHLYASTKSTNDKGEDSYDVQIIIPKSDKEGIKSLLRAIQTVGKAKWGDNWKKVRQPLRDGDKEADDITDDGKTKGEKYPERLGCYFINARSTKPVTVVDRQRTPILEPSDVYGGCKGKINVTFYPYAQQGNSGIGAGLNGVQKIAEGEPFGAGAPPVESMFDMLDDEDEFDVDEVEDEFDEIEEDEIEEEPEPPKRAAKKAPAKKAPARRKAPEPEPEDEEEYEDEDDLDDLDADEEEDDLYDDLEDEDEVEEEPEPVRRPAKKAAAKKAAAPAKKAAARSRR